MTADVDPEPGDVEEWFDEAAGPLVRPYAMTRGRTRSGGHELNIITIVFTLVDQTAVAGLEPEYRQILEACQSPLSIAEIASAVDLPMAVVKVLVGDLIDREQVLCRSPITEQRLLTTSFLQVVLDGIERI